MEERFLIVGLGNPGSAYTGTRHNVGFALVHAFAEKHRFAFGQEESLKGEIARGELFGKEIWLLLPTTFMNASGEAVKRAVESKSVPLDHVLIVSDDVALKIGQVRMRPKGSTGGHNGLKSIEAHLRTVHYARLRIGVGAPKEEALSDFVLGHFLKEEEETLQGALLKGVEVLEMWLQKGMPAAMQCANAKRFKEEGDSNVQTTDTSL